MSDDIQHSVRGTAHRVAGGVQGAANQVQDAACRARGGIGEVRDAIRAQPITAALVVFTLGYIFGRLGSLIPSASGHSSSGHSSRGR